MPEQLESLLQLGFAAATAGWLIKWLTSTMQSTVDKNTAAILGLQLYVGELYRLLLSHDLKSMGVNLTANENDTEAHAKARQTYEDAVTRLNTLTTAIDKVLEKMK